MLQMCCMYIHDHSCPLPRGLVRSCESSGASCAAVTLIPELLQETVQSRKLSMQRQLEDDSAIVSTLHQHRCSIGANVCANAGKMYLFCTQSSLLISMQRCRQA